nr:ABC transporter ATP-binding protein [Candidatus Hecatella orcuttiae]
MTIKDGEFLCLLGPSGCGKTTTLRMIAGLETPTKGEIYIGDVLVNDLPSKDRDVAMVFQFYAIYPEMKVFDQIAFPLKMLKKPKEEIDKAVKEVAELLGITDVLNFPVERLTMEQKQKIELGRAIVTQPKVYLFDEPLTNLDTKVRARTRIELKKLQQRLKTTTIYVTHDQLEALTLADRIAVMHLGRLQQCDTPDMLYRYPKNFFVAGFIGSPPMDFIDCTLVEKDGRFVLDAGIFSYDVTEFKEDIEKLTNSREFVIGVRPEFLTLSLTKTANSLAEAYVDIIEPLGARMIVNLKVGNYTLKANVRKMPLTSGEKVWFGFDKDKLRLFDKKTEHCII